MSKFLSALRMRVLSITLIALFCFTQVSYAYSASDAVNAKRTVLISEVAEHPAFEATINGIIDALSVNGYERGQNLTLRLESAQANAALAAQIASKYVHQNPDVVVGVGTISAQSFIKASASGKVMLVFASVTDPLKANIVKSLNAPGNNTSGVSNMIPLEPQLQLFQQLQPHLKRLGILYNPGEINSVSVVQQLAKICPKLGITLVKQTVTKTADVAQNAVKLAQNADAILISNDNTSLSALQSVIKAAQKAKIPVYVSDTDAVAKGAVAALGPNQYQVGFQAGEMIVRVLEGADINTQPVEFPNKTDLYINLTAAKKAGITVPAKILHEATKIIE